MFDSNSLIGPKKYKQFECIHQTIFSSIFFSEILLDWNLNAFWLLEIDPQKKAKFSWKKTRNARSSLSPSKLFFFLGGFLIGLTRTDKWGGKYLLSNSSNSKNRPSTPFVSTELKQSPRFCSSQFLFISFFLHKNFSSLMAAFADPGLIWTETCFLGGVIKFQKHKFVMNKLKRRTKQFIRNGKVERRLVHNGVSST